MATGLDPCLKGLVACGWIVEDRPVVEPRGLETNRRSKIVYKLTPAGEARFRSLLSDAGPSAWEDENFGVHFAFFGRTDAAIRLRILEGRRSRLEERLDLIREQVTKTRERIERIHAGAPAPRSGVGRT